MKTMSAASKRPYRKRKRARAEEETRRRITEAAVELHGTVGPAKTTVTDLAELAGVSRMTVYNHFPTEAELFAACSSHWTSQNPFPDPERWSDIEDPEERLRTALGELYEWYDANQDMLGKTLRDAQLLPTLEELMDDVWGGFIGRVVAVLAAGWLPEDPVREAAVRVTLRVAVDFHTWCILSASGLDDGEAAELASGMVTGATVATV